MVSMNTIFPQVGMNTSLTKTCTCNSRRAAKHVTGHFSKAGRAYLRYAYWPSHENAFLLERATLDRLEMVTTSKKPLWKWRALCLMEDGLSIMKKMGHIEEADSLTRKAMNARVLIAKDIVERWVACGKTEKAIVSLENGVGYAVKTNPELAAEMEELLAKYDSFEKSSKHMRHAVRYYAKAMDGDCDADTRMQYLNEMIRCITAVNKLSGTPNKRAEMFEDALADIKQILKEGSEKYRVYWAKDVKRACRQMALEAEFAARKLYGESVRRPSNYEHKHNMERIIAVAIEANALALSVREQKLAE